MADVKVSIASAMPEHHHESVPRSDRPHSSTDHPASDASPVPDADHVADHACDIDHASTCSTDDKTSLSTQTASSAQQPYPSDVGTASPNTPPLPPPPAKLCKQPAAPVKDFIHKMPLPLPANHPSIKAARKLHRRCSPCTQRIICACCLLFAVIFLLAIALLVFYLAAQPRLPKYDIESLAISKLKLTNSTSQGAGSVINTAMAVHISVRNPNKKMKVSHEILQVSVLYEGVLISEGFMEALINQSPGSQTLLKVMAHADMVSMERSVADSLKETLPSVPVHVDIHTHVALKLGGWTSKHVSIHVGCWVLVTFPATSEFFNSCDLHVGLPFLLLFPSIIF